MNQGQIIPESVYNVLINITSISWWLTEEQQEYTESIVNNQVFTICNELILEADDYIEFDNSYDDDNEEYYEIFVYYIVSDWLYEQLQSIRACVTEYKGLYIWGRCDFNQGLDMNS